MKTISTITALFIFALTGCNHNHEMLPHDHEIPPHSHNGIADETTAEIVSISDHPYTPDTPPDDNTRAICSGKVLIVFSQVPLNTEVSVGVRAYYELGREAPGQDRVQADDWWEQERETVTIYFDYRYRWDIDHYTVGGVIDWHSGRKHFEISIE